MYYTMFVAGFIIAFGKLFITLNFIRNILIVFEFFLSLLMYIARGYKLALVLLSVIPLMGLAGGKIPFINRSS